MGLRQRIWAAALVPCALLCMLGVLWALPQRAHASATQESSLMDDDELIYSTPAHQAQRLREIAALGVDRVKVSMVWSLVAPDANSTRRPGFAATNPDAYPPGAWDRYDKLVRLARSLGMGVYFQITPLSPLWALPRHQANQGPQLGRAPVASLLRQFVQAVGRRYSGNYMPPQPAPAPAPAASSPLPVLAPQVRHEVAASAPAWASRSAHQAADPAGAAVPRVDYWGIWNEPNERSWLNPYYRNLGHRRVENLQPLEYRSIVDAAWSGLIASGHSGDTILIGETANRGILTPVAFQLGLYCLSPSLRPLRGQSATLWGCPTRPNRAAFVKAHPGLFHMTGYAHHPYVLDAAPTHASPYPGAMTLDNLGQTERRLRGIFAAYRVSRPGVIPLYMTEWGYKTRPPNPYVRTSLAQQATWLNQGEYMTWQSPYVAALTQFELVDSPPKPGQPRGSFLYWSSFQTGLILRTGRRKPAYDAFRIPIWLPRAHHGRGVTVWGELRPADHSTAQVGTVEFRAPRGTWSILRPVQTTSPEGVVLAHVDIPSAGSVRLTWQDPSTSRVYVSRSVSVS